MRSSVTNSYIVNLAVSDFCFLVGLPFLIVTAVRRQWIFGHVCCKLFLSLTALNWFTSVRTLDITAENYIYSGLSKSNFKDHYDHAVIK